MFHKHKFIKDGLNLWCECGEVKKLDCPHKWKVHSQESIQRQLSPGCSREWVDQKQQILICEVCGKIKSVNLTTGVVQDKDDYINIKYNYPAALPLTG